jgi:hypothetical protein
VADDRANHARHDVELVAAWAAGEATGADLVRAERQLDACDLCVGVARDIRAITLAVQSLPAVSAIAELPAAPRDFRLTPEQAARLRPSGVIAPVQRWTDRLAAAVAAFGRPVGASLATLGVVGLLVGAATFGSLGGTSTGATVPAAADANATAAPSGAGRLAAGAEPAATKSATTGTELGPMATGMVAGAPGTEPQSAAASASPGTAFDATTSPAPGSSMPGPTAWLLVLSGFALVGGIGLIVLATRRG